MITQLSTNTHAIITQFWMKYNCITHIMIISIDMYDCSLEKKNITDNCDFWGKMHWINKAYNNEQITMHQTAMSPPPPHEWVKIPKKVVHAPLLWRHNGRDGISNHQPHDCLLVRLFRRRSKKTSKLHVTGLCAGNSPATGEFPAQMASNAENVSIWWRHHVSEWRVIPDHRCLSPVQYNVTIDSTPFFF